jgi:hypothetical protein
MLFAKILVVGIGGLAPIVDLFMFTTHKDYCVKIMLSCKVGFSFFSFFNVVELVYKP